MRVPHVLLRLAEKSEEGVGSHGTEVTDGYESPCGCWELKTGPLQEQQNALHHRVISHALQRRLFMHPSYLKFILAFSFRDLKKTSGPLSMYAYIHTLIYLSFYPSAQYLRTFAMCEALCQAFGIYQ